MTNPRTLWALVLATALSTWGCGGDNAGSPAGSGGGAGSGGSAGTGGGGAGGESTQNGPRPSVVSISPPAGATDVSVDTEVWIEFSQEMHAMSVQQGITLNGPNGAVAGTVAIRDGDFLAIFTPNEPLVEFETAYSVIFGDGILNSVAAVLTPQAPSGFTTAMVDPGYFYRLSTSFMGPDQVLDTFADSLGCYLADASGNTSGSFWRFERDPNDASFYAISNSFRPDLFLEGSNGTQPCLISVPSTPRPSLSLFPGQQWRLVRVEGHPTSCGPPVAGFFFMQTAFRGDGEALDTGTMAAIGCFTGQYWLPTRAGRI